MTKEERFNKAFLFLKYEGVFKTQEEAGYMMGASRSNISQALKGKESVLTDNFLKRFARAYRQISLNWLLYEEGPMLTVTPNFKAENTPSVLESGDEDKDVIEEQTKMTRRIMELIRESRHIPKTFALEADIELSLFQKKLKGEAAWSVADVHKICDTFKIRKGWLMVGKGQKQRLPDEVLETIPARSYNIHVGVPYYNVDFSLGFDLLVNEQGVNPDYMIDFEPYNKADAWCNARGNSMSPTIANGDVIAIKEVRDPKSCLINDEIYAIVTTNDLRTIKRIKDNGDTITLIPDNKEYSEQTISKEMILKVYRVMGSIKMF